jgi:hypothetical protein
MQVPMLCRVGELPHGQQWGSQGGQQLQRLMVLLNLHQKQQQRMEIVEEMKWTQC